MSNSTMSEPINVLEINDSDFKKFLDSFDHVFSDCDGVIWTIDALPRVGEFFQRIEQHGKTVHFVSNNSIRTKEEYEEKFKSANIKNGFERLTIPSVAFAEYLKSLNFDKKIYCVTCPETVRVLESHGFKCFLGPEVLSDKYQDYFQYLEDDLEVGAVIFDCDFKVNLPRIYKAMTYLKRPEVLFLGGATDKYVPYKPGQMMLSTGIFTDLVIRESKRDAIQLGKPGKLFGEFAMKRAGVEDPSRVLFIGDMIEQDIKLGKNTGFKTMLVLSNHTKEDMLANATRPDYYADSLGSVIWTIDALPRVGEFFQRIEQHGKTVHFVSNNSIRTKEEYEEKFKSANIKNGFERLTIPSVAFAEYLKSLNFDKKIYCVTCPETVRVLESHGFKCFLGPEVLSDKYQDYFQYLEDDLEVGAVIFDCDFKVNLPRIYKAMTYLKRPEVLFLGGATDKYVPYKPGQMMLSTGIFTDLVIRESKRDAIQLGKPGKLFGEFAMKRAGVEDPSRVLFIGDMIEQDIKLGKNTGFKTMLVLSNHTKEDMLANATRPDYYADSLGSVIWTIDALPRVGEFFQRIEQHGKTVHFVSNNSIRTKEEYEEKFKSANIKNGFERLTIPSVAFAEYLKSLNFDKKIYCVTCPETVRVLESHGFKCFLGPEVLSDKYQDYFQYLEDDLEVGAVIFDCDFKVNLPRIYKAMTYLKRPEVLFLGGATDKYVPYKPGQMMLSTGIFTDLVIRESKRDAIQLGKPGKLFGEFAMKRAGVEDPSRVLFIGDMIEQDIKLGKNTGFKTMLVLSNHTKEDMLANATRPDYYADSLGSMVPLL